MKVADLYAELGLELDKAGFRQGERAIDKLAKKTDSRLSKLGKSLGRKLFSAFKYGLAGAAAGLGVAVREELSFDKTLTDLDIAGQGALGTMDQMRERFHAMSRVTGVAREELAAGAARFVELTGDGKAAAASIELFGKVAKGSGIAMTDVAGVAARLRTNLKIDPKDFEKTFSILIRSGKAGNIELRNMAEHFAELGPHFANFTGGTGIEGARSLATALQIVGKGTGNAAEAATAMGRAMDSLTDKETIKRLHKLGVDTIDKSTGKARAFLDIVDDLAKSDLVRKDGGLDAVLFGETFTNIRARRAFNALLQYHGEIEGIRKATIGADDANQDFARRQLSSAEKMSRAWNDFKLTIANTLTPERVAAFTKALSGALKVAAALVQTISDFFGQFGGPAAGSDARKKRLAGKSDAELRAMGGTLEPDTRSNAQRAAARLLGQGEKDDAGAELRRRNAHRKVALARIEAGSFGTRGRGGNAAQEAAKNISVKIGDIKVQAGEITNPLELARKINDVIDAEIRKAAEAVAQ